ncbi:Hypothetical predicted protein [Paramuricea clavata]|uniref:Uncharacterized protein n=1 Tax=Paramuricea clavata TaxID=317549 RepID=A0A6S7HSV9_PARCT|nr:Hypothetical predicted protein [Paramuricea clavata]
MGRGGGARDISLPVCSTKEEILKEMISIFFTNGSSVFGDACAMKFELGNFKCEEIKDEGFTLARYITQHKLSKARIYLLSKLEEGNERVSLSNSEDELPSAFELPPAFDSPDHECQSSAILLGSSLERSRLREQQDAEFRESLFRDQQTEIEKEQEMEQFRDQLNKQENLYKARCERVPQEPNLDDPHANMSVRHVILGVKSRKFPLSCQVSSRSHVTN